MWCLLFVDKVVPIGNSFLSIFIQFWFPTFPVVCCILVFRWGRGKTHPTVSEETEKEGRNPNHMADRSATSHLKLRWQDSAATEKSQKLRRAHRGSAAGHNDQESLKASSMLAESLRAVEGASSEDGGMMIGGSPAGRPQDDAAARPKGISIIGTTGTINKHKPQTAASSAAQAVRSAMSRRRSSLAPTAGPTDGVRSYDPDHVIGDDGTLLVVSGASLASASPDPIAKLSASPPESGRLGSSKVVAVAATPPPLLADPLSSLIAAAKAVENAAVRNDFLAMWSFAGHVMGPARALKQLSTEQLDRLRAHWMCLTGREPPNSADGTEEAVARLLPSHNPTAAVGIQQFYNLLAPAMIEMGEFTFDGHSIALHGRRNRRRAAAAAELGGSGSDSSSASGSEGDHSPRSRTTVHLGDFIGGSQCVNNGAEDPLPHRTHFHRARRLEGMHPQREDVVNGDANNSPASQTNLDGASPLLLLSRSKSHRSIRRPLNLDESDLTRFVRDLFMSIDLDRTGKVSWEEFVTFVIERAYGHTLDFPQDHRRRALDTAATRRAIAEVVDEGKRRVGVFSHMSEQRHGGGYSRFSTTASSHSRERSRSRGSSSQQERHQGGGPWGADGRSTTSADRLRTTGGGVGSAATTADIECKVNPVTGTRVTLQYKGSTHLGEPYGVPHWISQMKYFPGWDAVGCINHNVAGVILLEQLDYRATAARKSGGVDMGEKPPSWLNDGETTAAEGGPDEDDEEAHLSDFDRWKRTRFRPNTDGLLSSEAAARRRAEAIASEAQAAAKPGAGMRRGFMYARAVGAITSMDYLHGISVFATLCNAAERQLSLHAVHGRDSLGPGRTLRIPLPTPDDGVSVIRSYHKPMDVMSPDARLTLVAEQEEKALMLVGTKRGRLQVCSIATNMLRKGSVVSSVPVLESHAMHTADLTECLVLPRSGKVVTSGLDNRVLLHDPNSGVPFVGNFAGHEKGVYLLSYCPSFEIFFSGGFEFKALCWAENLPNCPAFELHDHTSPHAHPLAAIFNVEGTPQVYTVDCAGVAKLFDVRSLKVLDSWRAFDGNRVPLEVANEIRSGALRGVVHWGDVGAVCYTGGAHRTMVLSGRRMHAFHTEAQNADAERAHDLAEPMCNVDVGKRSFVTAAQQSVKIWSVGKGVETAVHPTARFSHAPVTAVRVDSTSNRVFTGHQDGSIVAFDADSSVLCRRFLKHDAPIKALEIDALQGHVISTSLRGDFFVWDDPGRLSSPFSSSAHVKHLCGSLTPIPSFNVRHSPVVFPTNVAEWCVRDVPLHVTYVRQARWVVTRWRRFARQRASTRVNKDFGIPGAGDAADSDVRFITTTSTWAQLYTKYYIAQVALSPRFMLAAALSCKANCRVIDYTHRRPLRVVHRLFHGEDRELCAVSMLAERGLVAVSDALGGVYIWMVQLDATTSHRDGSGSGGCHPSGVQTVNGDAAMLLRASAPLSSPASRRQLAPVSFPVPVPDQPAILLSKFMNKCQVLGYSHPLKELGHDDAGAEEAAFVIADDALLEPEIDEADRQLMAATKLLQEGTAMANAAGGRPTRGGHPSLTGIGGGAHRRRSSANSVEAASDTGGNVGGSNWGDYDKGFHAFQGGGSTSSRPSSANSSSGQLDSNYTSRRQSSQSAGDTASGLSSSSLSQLPSTGGGGGSGGSKFSLAALPAVTALLLDRIRQSIYTGDDVGFISVYDLDPIYSGIGDHSVALLQKIATGCPPRFVIAWRGHEYPITRMLFMPHSMYALVTNAIDNIAAVWACDGSWVAGLRQGPIVHRVWHFPSEAKGRRALVMQRWGRLREAVKSKELLQALAKAKVKMEAIVARKRLARATARATQSTPIAGAIPVSGPLVRRTTAPGNFNSSASPSHREGGDAGAEGEDDDDEASDWCMPEPDAPVFSRALIEHILQRKCLASVALDMVKAAAAVTAMQSAVADANAKALAASAWKERLKARRGSRVPIGTGSHRHSSQLADKLARGSVSSSASIPPGTSPPGQRTSPGSRQLRLASGATSNTESETSPGACHLSPPRASAAGRRGIAGMSPDKLPPQERHGSFDDQQEHGPGDVTTASSPRRTGDHSFPSRPPTVVDDVPAAPLSFALDVDVYQQAARRFHEENRQKIATSQVAHALQRAYAATGRRDPDEPERETGHVLGDDPLRAEHERRARFKALPAIAPKLDPIDLARAARAKLAAQQREHAEKHLATMAALRRSLNASSPASASGSPLAENTAARFICGTVSIGKEEITVRLPVASLGRSQPPPPPPASNRNSDNDFPVGLDPRDLNRPTSVMSTASSSRLSRPTTRGGVEPTQRMCYASPPPNEDFPLQCAMVPSASTVTRAIPNAVRVATQPITGGVPPPHPAPRSIRDIMTMCSPCVANSNKPSSNPRAAKTPSTLGTRRKGVSGEGHRIRTPTPHAVSTTGPSSSSADAVLALTAERLQRPPVATPLLPSSLLNPVTDVLLPRT